MVVKMSKGFISLHRELQDHWLWHSEKFTKAQAWVDLLMLANHKELSVIFIRGIKVEVKRGEIAWSEENLASKWRWSRPKVKNFINMLKAEKQIETRKTSAINILRLVNFERFQHVATNKPENSENKKREKKIIDCNYIISKLSDKALQTAKENAPAWDIYHLASIYSDGIKERGFPNSLNAAFPAWCLRYTKGKRPA